MKKSSKTSNPGYNFLGICFLWTASGVILATFPNWNKFPIGIENKGIGRFYAGGHFVENSLQKQPLAKFAPYEEEDESYSTKNTKKEGSWRKNDGPSTTELRSSYDDANSLSLHSEKRTKSAAEGIKSRLYKLLWAKFRKKRRRQRFIKAQKQGVSTAGRTIATLRIPQSQHALPWLSILRMLPEDIGTQSQLKIQQCLWRKMTEAAAMNRPAPDTTRQIDKMSYMFTANNFYKATPRSTDLDTGYGIGAPDDPCSDIYTLHHPKHLKTAVFSPSQAIPHQERFRNQARKFQKSHHYRSK